jgi:hypothetical protein
VNLHGSPWHQQIFTSDDPSPALFARYSGEGSYGHLRRGEIMQAAQLTIANPNFGQTSESSLTAKIGDWMARVFGCWHLEMSRPFSHQGQAYRVCVSCGAQRRFNLGNWEMQGTYYYRKPSTKSFQTLGLAAVRRVSH